MGLDATDRRLVGLLSQDGRRSAADLAKELGLSRQAVADRIRGLERRGVVRGYRADVDPGQLGLTVQAQIRLAVDARGTPEGEKRLLGVLRESPLVRSVYRVSGEDCFVVHVLCRGIPDVNALLARLVDTGAVQASRTSFVLEVLLETAALGPLPARLLEEETL